EEVGEGEEVNPSHPAHPGDGHGAVAELVLLGLAEKPPVAAERFLVRPRGVPGGGGRSSIGGHRLGRHGNFSRGCGANSGGVLSCGGPAEVTPGGGGSRGPATHHGGAGAPPHSRAPCPRPRRANPSLPLLLAGRG